MAASKVLPVDSAVETTRSKTPNSTPDEDVTAAPAPTRANANMVSFARRVLSFERYFLAYLFLNTLCVMLFIILALCGWDRSAFHLALKAFDIYFRFSFILIVSVGAFLMLLAIVQPPFDIGTVVFGLIGAIMWGILICNLVLELVHDGIDVKQSCAIVAAVYLLLFALAWYGTRHARSAAAAEATTNTPEPKRKVIPELV